MGVQSSINTLGHYVMAVQCDACGELAPQAESPKRPEALTRAEKLAEDAGFLYDPADKSFHCFRCRVKRWPDSQKAQFPRLCAEAGVPLPAADPLPAAPAPKVNRQRRPTARAPEPGKTTAGP